MKKILFITAFTPSEVAAAEKNTKYMLNDLSKSFVVDLVYFRYENDVDYHPESSNICILRTYPYSTGRKIVNCLHKPFLHPYFTVRYDKSFLNLLQRHIDSKAYSAIVFDHSLTFLYARKLKYNGPKLMICHDVMAQRAERASNKLFAGFCLRSEKKMVLLDHANIFTFCKKDKDLLRRYYNVDANVIFDYIDDKIIKVHPHEILDEYVMLANWKRADNADGAIWLLNKLGDYLPEKIKINIIGKDFPMDRLKLNKKIEVNNCGFVENPYPLISESRAMLSPLLTGAGIKVKVMESLACGTPVIGTNISFEGFSDKFNSFMEEANSPEEFANKMLSLNKRLEQRISFRSMFLNEYQSESIPQWIEKLTK